MTLPVLPPEARRVYQSLLLLAGEARPSMGWLAERSGLSREDMLQALGELTELGYLSARPPGTMTCDHPTPPPMSSNLLDNPTIELARAVSDVYNLDWTGYPKTLPDDYRMTAPSDLALFLGGDCSSFTGDLLRLIAKSQATVAHFHALLTAFPYAVVAWSVFQVLPVVNAGQLAAVLRGDEPS
ncbi:hypothetical protein [Micromonospora sp. WMMC273]|uniref:hypothetical protein n=1 Tax=Micromonospora sp. WMMC273 TaxID=3015157 RepID=UPI0022B74421|nr:hypothetical protein [Micromonospora sp. WMMC273]MCZ7478816.1 hypothetical protein [Micromonospora sp. WMMC273]MCZ7478944.1 hypothetical protein [Micromonospora sp. WMMC273]